MKVGFHCDSFSLRGVTVATLAYARAWNHLSGHQSILIKCDGQTPWIIDRDPKDDVEGIEIIRYQNSEELHKVIKKTGIEALYVLSDGKRDKRFESLPIQLWIHAVFPSRISDIHGDHYACVSDWLAKDSFNNNIPFVPHIVDTPTRGKGRRTWRESHNIPANATIIGSMGGRHSFDLKIARHALHTSLERRKDLYFIGLNHHSFLKHERALFLKGTNNLAAKADFIDGCDAMLHGRTQGETFGLACAEFTAGGRPVLAWRHAPERHHLEHFCPPRLQYSTTRELQDLLLEFHVEQWDPGALQNRCLAFQSHAVASQFETVFTGMASLSSRPPHFDVTDKALIFKRRLQRSLRARLSRLQQEPINQDSVTIDPISGYPMEE